MSRAIFRLPLGGSTTLLAEDSLNNKILNVPSADGTLVYETAAGMTTFEDITVTGEAILAAGRVAAAPSASTDIANKAYVDSEIVAAAYSAGTGLTLTGNTFSITPVGTAGTYGSASQVPVFITNASGQISSVTNTPIDIAASQMTSGTIASARISGSYTGITAIGTLTDLTVTNTITGSISGNAATATNVPYSGLTGTVPTWNQNTTGNAATATLATSATSATTATNIAGGASGSIPYQTGSGATALLAKGTNGQVLSLVSGLPAWISVSGAGTVTSVDGSGGTTGLTLTGGPITASGTLTLGGTLAAANGGTGQSSYTTGDLLYASDSTSVSKLAVGTNGYILTVSAGLPSWQPAPASGITSFETSLSGLTPSTTTTGAVTLAGTLAVASGGTGATTAGDARSNLGLGSMATQAADSVAITGGSINGTSLGATTAASAKVTTLDIGMGLTLATDAGTSGQVLTSAGAGSVPTWVTPAGGVTLANDTSTSSNLYPTFAGATTGSVSTIYTGNAKLLYKPSTGEFQSTVLNASNGIVVNNATVSENYTIPSGSNAVSAGPVTVASGITVTVSSGSVWAIV